MDIISPQKCYLFHVIHPLESTALCLFVEVESTLAKGQSAVDALILQAYAAK